MNKERRRPVAGEEQWMQGIKHRLLYLHYPKPPSGGGEEKEWPAAAAGTTPPKNCLDSKWLYSYSWRCAV